MWRHFKDRVSMIAYNSIELLQQQLSHITKQITVDTIKSIAEINFINKHLRMFLMSNWYKPVAINFMPHL